MTNSWIKVALLTAATMGGATMAGAQGVMKPMSPPTGHNAQWWTSASGCEYSRSGRPGELVWFLTRVPKGAACPEFIMQQKLDDTYRPPYMIKG